MVEIVVNVPPPDICQIKVTPTHPSSVTGITGNTPYTATFSHPGLRILHATWAEDGVSGLQSPDRSGEH